MSGTTFNVVMGAWTKEDLQAALVASIEEDPTWIEFVNLIRVPKKLGNVTVIFVVPAGTEFTEPNTDNEVATDKAFVDCSSLEMFSSLQQQLHLGPRAHRHRYARKIGVSE